MGLLSSKAKSSTKNFSDQSYSPNQQRDIGATQIQAGSIGKKGTLSVIDSRDMSDKRQFIDSRQFADSSQKNSNNTLNSNNYYSDSRSYTDNSSRSFTTTDHGAVQGALNNNYAVVNRAIDAIQSDFSRTSGQLSNAYAGFTDNTEQVHQNLLGTVKTTGTGLADMGNTLVKLFLGLVVATVGVVFVSRTLGMSKGAAA